MKKVLKNIRIDKKSIALLLIAILIWGIDHIDFTFAKTNDTKKEKIVSQEQENKFGFEKVKVKRVIDGDTIELSDSRIIRLLGINTPEDTKEKEIYGDIATSYVKDLIEGKYVYLESDVEDKDKYGRYIRNVWIDLPITINETNMKECLLNVILLDKGIAKPMTVSPNIKYSELYNSISQSAKNEKKGMFNMSENGTTKGDF